jgi:hypothetical protein
MPKLLATPSKPIMPINFCIVLEKGFFGKEEMDCIRNFKIVI